MTFADLTALAAEVVAATQKKLPPEIRPLARDVPVHYEATPASDVLADGFPEDILGLFVGSPHGMELESAGPMLPQILLYLDNIWQFVEENAAAFRKEIRLTYLHELGHYLGWGEDELTMRGLE